MPLRSLNTFFLIGRPISPLYSALMNLRAMAYKRNLLKTNRLDIPVISIGNLSMGGTGKTPHVIEVAIRLKSMGHTPAIITRGYGGKAGKGPLIACDGKGYIAPNTLAGDEAVMMAKALNGETVVICGSHRYGAALVARERFGATVVILDDGFQHLRLHRDMDVVLLPASSPFGNGRVFPGGDLREDIRAIGRADCIILTKCNELEQENLTLSIKEIKKYTANKPIFLSYYRIQRVVEAPLWSSAHEERPFGTKGPLFIFCGIGQPSSFLTLLKEYNYPIAGHLYFRDHHRFSPKDIKKIVEMARYSGAKGLLTTEKDMARLDRQAIKELSRHLPLGVVRLGLEIQPTFWDFLTNLVNSLQDD